MTNLPSFFAFLSAAKKNLSEEYDEAINSATAPIEVRRHETAGPEHYTSY